MDHFHTHCDVLLSYCLLYAPINAVMEKPVKRATSAQKADAIANVTIAVMIVFWPTPKTIFLASLPCNTVITVIINLDTTFNTNYFNPNTNLNLWLKMPEPETKTPETASGLASLAGDLLGQPEFQKSLIDMAQPMMAANEAVLTKVIESQNLIQQTQLEIIKKLDLLTSAVKIAVNTK